MHTCKRGRFLPWLLCLGVVALCVPAWAAGGQEVKIAVLYNGQLVTDAAIEWTHEDGTTEKVLSSDDGTLYMKSASGKAKLLVHLGDLGSAETEVSLPPDAVVDVVIQYDGVNAQALVVSDERFPTVQNTVVLQTDSTKAASPDGGVVVERQPGSSMRGPVQFSRGSAAAIQGGDDCASATVIASLPFSATGTTVGYADDYNEVCPYTPTGGLDVVYSYAPAADTFIDISVCESAYDTKLYVYEDSCPGTVVDCNDDACTNSAGDDYRSFLGGVEVLSGHTYFIVVDGYNSSESGAYEIVVDEVAPPPPPAEECPTGNLFFQPADGDSAANSDEYGGFQAFESFTAPPASNITGVRWRGIHAYFDPFFGWLGCDRGANDDYQITFHPDVAGEPGVATCSYTLTPTRSDSGDTFAGLTVWQYDADISASACFISEGWVSIWGIGNSTCWGLWISSFTGDGTALQYDGATYSATDYDMDICLTGEQLELYGACCDDFTAVCQDCVLAADCTGRFSPETTCADQDPFCGTITGGCCLDGGADCQDLTPLDCAAAGGVFQGLNTSCPANICEMCGVYCPPGAAVEGEPVCAEDYDDTFNGGCNATTPVFSDIACGDTVCGEAGTFIVNDPIDGPLEFRDTDWYRFTVANDTEVTWTVQADFPVLFGIVDTGGVDDCGGVEDFWISATAASCEEAAVTACIPAGTWYAFVAPSVFTGVDCGSGYTASLTCADCPQGACCPGDGSCADTNILGCVDATWQGPGTSCATDPCPQNDTCDTAEALGLPGSVTASNVGGNDDDLETCGTSAPNQGIWYTVVGNGSTIKASTCNPGTDFDTKLQVWCDCAPVVCVGGNDDASGAPPECDLNGLNRKSIVEWCSAPGQTYYIYVGGFSTAVGTFELTTSDLGACSTPVDCSIPTAACCADDGTCLGDLTEADCATQTGTWYDGDTCATFTCPVVPPNDTCETATVIGAVPYNQTIDTTTAGSDGPPSGCNSSSAPTMDNDVWWTYTPAADCFLSIQVNTPGYDGVGAIYSGPDCNSLTELDCYDSPDDPTNIPLINATAGTTYWVQAGDWGTADGGGNTTLDLDCGSPTATGACCVGTGSCDDTGNLADCGTAGGDYQGDGTTCSPNPCAQPPANDDCAGAEALAVGNSVIVDNSLATDDADSTTTCGTGSLNQAVWYEVIGNGNELTASTCNAGGNFNDTKLQVWTGSCAALSCVGGNDDAGSANCAISSLRSTFSWCSDVGVSYFVAVGGYGSNSGLIELSVADGAACGGPAYCDTCWTESFLPYDDYITNVTFNTINNTTAEEGAPCQYNDFTAQSTSVVQGSTHQLSVSIYSSYTQHVWAWIDWNQDLDFEDAGEAYDLGSGTDSANPFTVDITVPGGASLGDTRMRVSERYNVDPTPCDSATYGSTEDYTVNVTSAALLQGPWDDDDTDGVPNFCDNCPDDFNDTQDDADGDGVGDVCDNCPDDANTDQANADGDIHGDVCDNCVNVFNNNQSDVDADTVGDVCDNCPDDANTDQTDSDNDGNGNACDICPGFDDFVDSDGDTVPDGCDQCGPIGPTDDDLAPGALDDADGDGYLNCNDLCDGVDDAVFAPECEGAIPTMSTWGLVVLALLLLVGSKIYFGRRSARAA